MEITTVLGIGFGVAMDAFAVAVTNGMAVRRLRIGFAIKQALIFALFQAFMPVLGWLAGITLSEKIELFGHWAAFIILCLLGVKMCREAKKKKHATDCFILEREPSMRVLIAMAVATSIDALAVGVTFACSDVEKFGRLLLNVLIIGAVTFSLCVVGGFLGRKSGDIFKGRSEIIGGVVLFIMALKIIAENIH